MAESGPSDDLLRRLLAAVAAETSDAHVERLIADARAEAEGEIAALVKSAYKALLLRRATEQLEVLTRTGPAGPAPPVAPPATPPANPAPPAPEPTMTSPRAGTTAPPPRFSAEHRIPDEADEAASPDRQSAACYIYAITPASAPACPGDVSAIDGRYPLEVVQHDEVQAIVSAVSLEDFSQTALDERVTDPQWVEEKVRAHDQVIKSAMSTAAEAGAGAVIPCRFCTVVRSADDVRALLAANHDSIVATLAALRGKQEWGVKIYADLSALARHLRNGGEEATTSGKNYLERKRHEETTRSEAERLARTQAEECHAAITASAADAALLPRRPRSAGAAEPVLNAAYLIADAEVSQFHDRVAALAERYHPLGMQFEVNGPWPPYNFVHLDLSLQAVA